MNVADIIILVLIAFGALIGFKRGFTRQLVFSVGLIAIVILSFLLKNPISVFLYNNLPFFNFEGVFKGVTVLNILLYEAIAFILVFIVLFIIFRVLLKITKIFEGILNATIILGIPSKLLGMVLGLIESIIIVFIALYFINLPMFNITLVKESKVSNIILDKTPLMHQFCDKSLVVFDKVFELKDEYKNSEDKKDFNSKALSIMIDYNIITKDNADKLIESGKLKM